MKADCRHREQRQSAPFGAGTRAASAVSVWYWWYSGRSLARRDLPQDAGFLASRSGLMPGPRSGDVSPARERGRLGAVLPLAASGSGLGLERGRGDSLSSRSHSCRYCQAVATVPPLHESTRCSEASVCW